MPAKRKSDRPAKFIAEWQLSPAATLGSSVRTKGILQEIRARLPWAQRRKLDTRGSMLVLGMPEDQEDEFAAASQLIAQALVGIDDLPVLPREIEDVLDIKTSERHRWLKDKRLQSAGTRTVKLRGRARKITFHVFDPRRVEAMLDDDLVSQWREEDIEARAEKRRQAAWKAKLKRAEKGKPASTQSGGAQSPQLAGWDAFEREGLLR